MTIAHDAMNGEKSVGEILREDLKQILRDLIQLGRHLIAPVLKAWMPVYERLSMIAEDWKNEWYTKYHQKEIKAAQKAMKEKLSKVVDIDRKSSRRR